MQHEFRLSNYFNHHKHKGIPIHSWHCELWLPEKKLFRKRITSQKMCLRGKNMRKNARLCIYASADLVHWGFIQELVKCSVRRYKGVTPCGFTIRWPSAPKTETTTNMMGGAGPWFTKAPGGTTRDTSRTWTAWITTVITRPTVTAWTGSAGKANTTPINAPRWKSGLLTSDDVTTQCTPSVTGHDTTSACWPFVLVYK